MCVGFSFETVGCSVGPSIGLKEGETGLFDMVGMMFGESGSSLGDASCLNEGIMDGRAGVGNEGRPNSPEICELSLANVFLEAFDFVVFGFDALER